MKKRSFVQTQPDFRKVYSSYLSGLGRVPLLQHSLGCWASPTHFSSHYLISTSLPSLIQGQNQTPESLSVCVLKTEGFINCMNFTHLQQWKSCWKTPKDFRICSFTCKWATGKRATKLVTALSNFPTIHSLHRYHKIPFLTGRLSIMSFPDVVLLWSMFSSQLPSTSRCFSSCYSL